MITRKHAVLIISSVLSASSVYAQARNAILFLGDGVGVPALNAASIYNYGKPHSLYIQNMPHVALSDTSTSREWVADGPSAATAWATGVKVHNKIVSETDATERGAVDGEHLKTIVEYAEERGLSTGLITNLAPAGVADPVISASYAHLNKPPRRYSGETFLQLLNMKYGDGPDVVIGTGREIITSQVKQTGKDLSAEIRKHGYTYVDSVAAVSKLNAENARVIALLDDHEFDLDAAVQQATTRLSRNPKGFLLIVLASGHAGEVDKSLEAIAAYDKVIRNVAEARKNDTLVLFAGNHSVDLHVIGENLRETSKSVDNREIAQAVYYEDEHTAEEAPVMAIGPGSERIRGYIPNTDIFNTMAGALGLLPKP